MRRLPHVLAAGLLAGVIAAQPPGGNLPRAYLVADPAANTWEDRETGLNLRPNAELPFLVYVNNPIAEPAGAVTVTLARDKDGKLPLAAGTLAGLKGNESARVKLAAASAPTPPPAPAAAPAKPGDPPAPPPAPAGVSLPDTVYLLTSTVTADGAIAREPEVLPVQVERPSSYIKGDAQPTFRLTDDGYELTVKLSDKQAEVNGKRRPFRGPPAKVRLDLRPALLDGLDAKSPKTGTYENAVPPGGSEVALVAGKLKFAGKPAGRFAVAVDGFDRAFVYEIGSEGNNATPLNKGFAQLDLPAFAVPGKPLPVRVEVFQDAAAGAKPALTFVRSPVGDPQQLLPADAGMRDETRSLRVGGEGELVLASTVKDWVIPVDTAGVYGKRTFKLGTAGDGVTPFEGAVTFDATPPALKLDTLPPTKLVGSTLQVFAAAGDDESGLTEVVFYLGEPPAADGKLPPTTEKAVGLPALAAKGGPMTGRFTASFLLPDVKGKVKLYAKATNGAGLSTVTEGVTLTVVDPPPPPKSEKEKAKEKRTVGDVAVKVIQGSTPERPQPGLTVELRNGAGAAVMTKTTDDKGEAFFKDVPPGGYTLYTVKLADYGAKAFAAVTVVADKKAEATLEVKR